MNRSNDKSTKEEEENQEDGDKEGEIYADSSLRQVALCYPPVDASSSSFSSSRAQFISLSSAGSLVASSSSSPRAESLKVVCAPCSQSKTRCDKSRPCSRCIHRGIQAQCVDRALPNLVKKNQRQKRIRALTACLPCSKSKVACDSSRPCKRCIDRGHADQCIEKPLQESSSSTFPKRQRTDGTFLFSASSTGMNSEEFSHYIIQADVVDSAADTGNIHESSILKARREFIKMVYFPEMNVFPPNTVFDQLIPVPAPLIEYTLDCLQSFRPSDLLALITGPYPTWRDFVTIIGALIPPRSMCEAIRQIAASARSIVSEDSLERLVTIRECVALAAISFDVSIAEMPETRAAIDAAAAAIGVQKQMMRDKEMEPAPAKKNLPLSFEMDPASVDLKWRAQMAQDLPAFLDFVHKEFFGTSMHADPGIFCVKMWRENGSWNIQYMMNQKAESMFGYSAESLATYSLEYSLKIRKELTLSTQYPPATFKQTLERDHWLLHNYMLRHFIGRDDNPIHIVCLKRDLLGRAFHVLQSSRMLFNQAGDLCFIASLFTPLSESDNREQRSVPLQRSMEQQQQQ